MLDLILFYEISVTKPNFFVVKNGLGFQRNRPTDICLLMYGLALYVISLGYIYDHEELADFWTQARYK